MSRYLVGILFCLVIALAYAAFRDEAFQGLRHRKIRKRDIRQKQKGALNFWFYTELEKAYGLGKYGVLLRLYPIVAGSFTVLHITFGWMESLATPDLILQLGDRLTVVGEAADIRRVEKILGKAKFRNDEYEIAGMVGVVTGLAWTAVGGDILYIESVLTPGKGALNLTGNLGDVMKESAQIAYQYIKAHPELTGMPYEEFIEKDIHVHVPEGAVPKDGPSAGITMVSSMVSAYRGQTVKSGIAMTGEMTLRGRVLPVGGIKEKILAAKRSGIHTIVISEDNRKDVEDIKDIYIKGLTFVYVNSIDEVIKYIF